MPLWNALVMVMLSACRSVSSDLLFQRLACKLQFVLISKNRLGISLSLLFWHQALIDHLRRRLMTPLVLSNHGLLALTVVLWVAPQCGVDWSHLLSHSSKGHSVTCLRRRFQASASSRRSSSTSPASCARAAVPTRLSPIVSV